MEIMYKINEASLTIEAFEVTDVKRTYLYVKEKSGHYTLKRAKGFSRSFEERKEVLKIMIKAKISKLEKEIAEHKYTLTKMDIIVPIPKYK